MHRHLIQPDENPESLSVWWEGSYLSITDKESGANIQLSGETAVEMARAIIRQDVYERLSQYQHVSLPLENAKWFADEVAEGNAHDHHQ